MVLSSLVALHELRVAIPTAYLSLSMVPFASVSITMNTLKWFIPRKLFATIDDLMYSSYMRACLFVFENVADVQINFYGDVKAVIAKRESAIVLSNHQSNVDWIVLTMIANRQHGNEKGVRFMIKYAIHNVPLFGWYTYQRGYVYVRRFGSVIWSAVERQLFFLRSLNEPFWLLIFPEGTRFSPKKCEIVQSSQQYCRRIGIPVLNNVLAPRTSGFILALTHLNRSLDAVYDITIAYDQSRELNRQRCAPNMFEFVCGGGGGANARRALHVHIKRFAIDELPQEKMALKKWLNERYQIKDGMLEAFYSGQGLPDLVIANAPHVPFSTTLPPAIIFALALIAPIFSVTFRKIYFLTICSSPILILWLRIRGSV